MDELLNIRNPELTKALIQKEIKRHKVYKGSVRVQPGHTMFKFEDGKVLPCDDTDYLEVEAKIDDKFETRLTKKIRTRPGVVYLPALNLKNAIKKFRKLNLIQVDEGL